MAVANKFRSNTIPQLFAVVKKNKGTLYIMTYLLPGKSNTVSPSHASDIDLSRSIQGAGNQIIRDLSQNTSIALIDIDRSVVAPTNWSAAWFQDHIHPTKIANDQIAESTLRHLVSYGELPISTIQE